MNSVLPLKSTENTPQNCEWKECPKAGTDVKVKKCAKCFTVSYCGADCQTKDWKAGHKNMCPKLFAAINSAPIFQMGRVAEKKSLEEFLDNSIAGSFQKDIDELQSFEREMGKMMVKNQKPFAHILDELTHLNQMDRKKFPKLFAMRKAQLVKKATESEGICTEAIRFLTQQRSKTEALLARVDQAYSENLPQIRVPLGDRPAIINDAEEHKQVRSAILTFYDNWGNGLTSFNFALNDAKTVLSKLSG